MEKKISFKILVVDDTPELLDITIRTLQKANYTVFSADNGATCMDAVQKEKPDLILLDVMLPDANGVDLAKEIKSKPESSSIFIILLSSLKTSSANISEGLEEGADGYIVRPVGSRELLARIESARRLIDSDKRLKAATLKYQTLFSAMQEGVYLHEMVYDEAGKAIDYRIIEANPASGYHLNINPTDAVGKLATKLYNTQEAPFLEIYSEVAKTGKAIAFEKYFPPLEKYFHISAFSPGFGKFATTFTDISERKRAEETLHVKSEELQKINAEKDKFFSIIAHDLRSPLNSILSFSELMVEDLQANNVEALEEDAEIILKSSQSAIDLLTNLMDWSQSQTGRMSFTPENFELNNLIHEVSQQLTAIAGQKSITISHDISTNNPIYADKAMIATVLRNLISNAIKFTPMGGNITISVAYGTNEIVLSVKDSGIGISKENIAKLFRIDQNFSTPGTNKEQGTGLGLILCKEFIEKHKGRIWVESEKEKGSTFSFTIPRKAGLEEKNGTPNENNGY